MKPPIPSSVEEVPALAEYWVSTNSPLPRSNYGNPVEGCEELVVDFMRRPYYYDVKLLSSIQYFDPNMPYIRYCTYESSEWNYYFNSLYISAQYFMLQQVPLCPSTPLAGEAFGYNRATQMCSRVRPPAPPPPPATACPAGQKPSQYPLMSPTANPAQPTYGCVLACATDTHANLDSTACVPNDACTDVAHLEPLPTAASDPCTAALHRLPYNQAAVDKVCGVPSANTLKEVACLAEKLAANGITMQINNKVRSEAYQAHFWDVWSKMIDVMGKNIQNDPLKKAACAARRIELAKEKGCNHEKACLKNKKAYCPSGGHCFASRPSQSPQSAHSQRRAIDISGDQAVALENLLRGKTPPQTIKQFLAAPSKATATTCPAVPLLRWGGDFVNEPPDRVHFYLDKP